MKCRGILGVHFQPVKTGEIHLIVLVAENGTNLVKLHCNRT